MKTEELIRALAANATPVRPLLSAGARSALWAAVALVCTCATFHALGERADLVDKLRDPAFLCENASLLFLFVLSARAAFRLSVPGLEASPSAQLLPWLGL